MDKSDANQMDDEINSQDPSLEEELVSNETGLKTIGDNQHSDSFNSEEKELENFADKQALEFEINNFGELLLRFDKSSQNLIQDLVKQNKELKQQAYALSKLPEKTGDQLMSLVPQISEELRKRVLEDFDHQLELTNVKINEMLKRLEVRHNFIDQSLSTSHAKQLENLNVLNARFEGLENTQLKRKILAYVTSTLLVFAVALSACWTTFKYFPSKVLINQGNNITVEGSDVTVWGKDFKIIEKIKGKEGLRPSKL